jgi:putative Mg2+ transporter-C (MgtC) family protein
VLTRIGPVAQQELSSLFEPEGMVRAGVRLSLALLLGAIVGWDRERRDADAGLRTHMLVCIGAALPIVVAIESELSPEALSRVIQGLLSGIGFLGAGAVLKVTDEGRIHGLTTAATIWATAAIGIAAGLGRAGIAVMATAFVLIVLAALRRAGKRIAQQARNEQKQASRLPNDRMNPHAHSAQAPIPPEIPAPPPDTVPTPSPQPVTPPLPPEIVDPPLSPTPPPPLEAPPREPGRQPDA